jgi:hypothetical protein
MLTPISASLLAWARTTPLRVICPHDGSRMHKKPAKRSGLMEKLYRMGCKGGCLKTFFGPTWPKNVLKSVFIFQTEAAEHFWDSVSVPVGCQ